MSLTKVSYSMITGASVSILDYGADPTGAIDSVAAIQAAIDAASASSKSVYIPDGTFLLDAITYIQPSALYAQRGENIFGLLFAKSNVTIYGNGKTSILKVANNQLLKQFTYTADVNSGTYANYAMPGTKGFQVFVNQSASTPVNNFVLRDFVIDMNGYNNKVFPVNAFGNQSICPAIQIGTGDNIVVDNVKFLNAPGLNTIIGESGVTNAIVSNCTFVDNGSLDGTNTNLLDHSTLLFMGSTYQIERNNFLQQVLVTKQGGCAIEADGAGRIVGNYIEKYNGGVLSSGILSNCNNTIKDNIGRDIVLGFEVQALNTFTCTVKIEGNDFTITRAAIANTDPAYQYRNAIAVTAQSNPGDVILDVLNNRFEATGTIGWATDAEELYNAFMSVQLAKSVIVKGNYIQGFRGPMFTLRLAAASSGIQFFNNSVVSCGRKNNFVDNNAVFNYINGDTSYGNTPFEIFFKHNEYSNSLYAAYFSFTGLAAGQVLFPDNIQIDGDVTNIWMSLMTVSAGQDLPSSYANFRWNFNYSCINVIDATQAAKVFPPSSTQYSRSVTGQIYAQAGLGQIPGVFSKIFGATIWQYACLKFGDSAPSASDEVSPFGANVGDTVKITNAAAGGNSGYYCITAGSVGTWKAYGTIAV